MVQDIAALEAIPILAQRYLPADCAVYSVLHQFMGIFPEDRPRADALIFSGALAGYFGKAQKIVCKTHLEAKGIPDTAAILGQPCVVAGRGLRGAHVGLPFGPRTHRMTNAMRSCARPKSCWTRLSGKPMSRAPPFEAFHSGQMDIPFPANDAAKGDIFPLRDANGGLRFGSTGNLPFSKASIDRNNALLKTNPTTIAQHPGA